jgi:hypothetical protein
VLRLKELWAQCYYKKVTGVGLKVLEKLERQPGEQAWFTANCADLQSHYSISVLFVKKLIASGLDRTS